MESFNDGHYLDAKWLN